MLAGINFGGGLEGKQLIGHKGSNVSRAFFGLGCRFEGVEVQSYWLQCKWGGLRMLLFCISLRPHSKRH